MRIAIGLHCRLVPTHIAGTGRRLSALTGKYGPHPEILHHQSLCPQILCGNVCLLLLWVSTNIAGAAQAIHPLAPPDRSSPRATLKTFLDSTNKAVEAFNAATGARQGFSLNPL